MKEIEIKWVKSAIKYSNSEYGRLGKWIVFYLHYDGTCPRGENKPWSLTTYLPYKYSRIGRFEDKKSAKDYAKKMVREWLVDANLWKE